MPDFKFIKVINDIAIYKMTIFGRDHEIKWVGEIEIDVNIPRVMNRSVRNIPNELLNFNISQVIKEQIEKDHKRGLL